MPYARRNAEGLVTSLHREAADGATEWLSDDHPEVLGFIGGGSDAAGFAQLDAGFIRVLEDLIDTLIGKNLINITDLPAQAQAKLFSRKGYRERSGNRALKLFGDADLDQLVPPRDGPAD